jgi:hypothetical protein
MVFFALQGKERESVRVFEVPLSASECEQQHRSHDQQQAHEDLQDHDLHARLRGERAATVTAMVVRELAGMSTAQRSGDMRPHRARATVTAL